MIRGSPPASRGRVLKKKPGFATSPGSPRSALPRWPRVIARDKIGRRGPRGPSLRGAGQAPAPLFAGSSSSSKSWSSDDDVPIALGNVRVAARPAVLGVRLGLVRAPAAGRAGDGGRAVGDGLVAVDPVAAGEAVRDGSRLGRHPRPQPLGPDGPPGGGALPGQRPGLDARAGR